MLSCPLAVPVEGQKGMTWVLSRVINHLGWPKTVLVLALQISHPVQTRTRVTLVLKPARSPCTGSRKER